MNSFAAQPTMLPFPLRKHLAQLPTFCTWRFQMPKVMSGLDLGNAFSFLRPNDLVWNYVVENYLKGNSPPPFDLLYWNGDSTNLPGNMYCWYLRHTYLQNDLIKPGKVTNCGEKIDLGKIKCAAYLYASQEDHIVPWQSA